MLRELKDEAGCLKRDLESIRAESAGIREEFENLKGTPGDPCEPTGEHDAAVKDLPDVLEELKAALEKLCESTGKHDIAIEDFLDVLTELKDGEESTLKGLSGELEKQRNYFQRMREEKDTRLPLLLASYRTQFLNMKALLSDDTEWIKQLEIIESKLDQEGLQAGFVSVGRQGEAVNYDLHEVIGVQETDDPLLDKCVAQVYETGCQCGDFVKKARVAAYKFIPV